MFDAPLYKAINDYCNSGASRFHTPSHKGDAYFLEQINELLKFDVTELPSTGSPLDGVGATFAAEEKAAKAFGVKGTIFSAGGCSLCVQSMLRLTSKSNRKIICDRNIHRSALNAIIMLDLDPVWLYPDICGFNLRNSKRIIAENNDASAAYITSPDYYGRIKDIEGVCKSANLYNIPVVVDNAHGAHLFAFEGMHPIERGAAMTSDSAHKTMPVLTGGAYLNINDNAFLPEARSAMSLFASTSPSFLIMLSLDLNRSWFEAEGKRAYSELKEKVDLIERSAKNKGLVIPKGERDPVRITLSGKEIGYRGFELADHLRAFGIEPEMFDDERVVLIPSPFNSNRDFIKLDNAINALKERTPLANYRENIEYPKRAMKPRDAYFAKRVSLDVNNSLGKISAETFSPCPPGIPLVIPGEIIDQYTVEILLRNGKEKIDAVNA